MLDGKVAQYLRQRCIAVVHVNPSPVKKSNGLNDHSPIKDDVKHALMTIDNQIKDGRYAEPVIPVGVHAELRNGMNQRECLTPDRIFHRFPKVKIIKNGSISRWKLCANQSSR